MFTLLQKSSTLLLLSSGEEIVSDLTDLKVLDPMDFNVLSLSLVLKDASNTPIGLCGTELVQLSPLRTGER